MDRPCEAETAILRRACRAYLAREADGGPTGLGDGQRLRAARHAIADNRLWRAVELGLERSDVRAPDWLRRDFAGARARAMMCNLRMIELARHALPKLEEAGIRGVVFKGPFLNRQLHGDSFFRRSSDLDLLVARRQFRQAIAVLGEHGFRPRHRGASGWWIHGLGEVHLQHSSGGTIDLHHRVQQPGCPVARRSIEFLRAVPEIEDLGGVGIAILRPRMALVLSALNLLKGVMKRQPSGHYALDVAAGTRALDQSELAQLGAFAHRQGLLRSMQLAIGIASRTFALPMDLPAILAPEGDGKAALPADWPIETMVLDPARADLEWPRRRRLLWAMSDGTRPLAKGANFMRDAARAAASETLRLLTSPTPDAAPEQARGLGRPA